MEFPTEQIKKVIAKAKEYAVYIMEEDCGSTNSDDVASNFYGDLCDIEQLLKMIIEDRAKEKA